MGKKHKLKKHKDHGYEDDYEGWQNNVIRFRGSPIKAQPVFDRLSRILSHFIYFRGLIYQVWLFFENRHRKKCRIDACRNNVVTQPGPQLLGPKMIVWAGDN